MQQTMPKSETSDSESAENSSSEELEAPVNGSGGAQNKKVSDYEKQRLKRIEENRARMEALGLKTMAKSFMGSAPKVKKKSEKKGKGKVDGDDDEDYKPAEDEDTEELSASGKEDDEDEDFTTTRKQKGKKKSTKPRKPIGNKGAAKNKLLGEPEYVDDDDALMQAIALSLQDSAGSLNVKTKPSQSSDGQVTDGSSSLKKQTTQLQDNMGKRKRKKISSRVQMTEDEVIIHFFQFDEAGKGSITLSDILRMAATHDFMWSDKEVADMINCFDSDGDGKLNLDDFRKIAGRCNMIQVPESSAVDQV